MSSLVFNIPIVSIVMAAYNEEKYIGEAIESILNQTFRDFEFIIVNDGSSDNTENIILSYKDDRIIYVKNEQNLKLIDSLNKGLSLARGKYIARMDSDDISEPNRLIEQVSFMESHPEIGISGAQLRLFGKEEGFMNYPLIHEDIKLRLFITSCFGNNVVIFKRDLLNKYDLFFPKGYIHAEDYKCWTNWILITKSANLNLNLVRYRSHSNSVSNKNKAEQRQTRNRVRQEYIMANFDVSSQMASDLVGQISKAKLRAIKFVLNVNTQKGYFDESKLKQVFAELWYLDSLESVENNFFVFLRYPRIFSIEWKSNFKRWLFVLKHFIKFKVKNNAAKS